MTLGKAVQAVISGLIAGLVVAFVLYVLGALTPIDLDAGFWGFWVGVLVALYQFFVDTDARLRR